LLKLAALLLFAMLIAPRFFEPVSWRDLVFVLMAVFIVRLFVFAFSMLKAGLSRRERLIAGWFGPKGFASVVYGYMILKASFPGSDHLAHLMGIAIVASVVVYSSTDILVARWLKKHPVEASQEQVERPAA
jgi:NhaP-type Na+/H+ or K+/H+ antiporter